MKKRQTKPTPPNISKLVEDAYAKGLGDASTQFYNDGDLKRSYNAMNVQPDFMSAERVIMSSAPTMTKDKTYADRFTEIRTSRAMADSNVWMARYLQSASARIYGKSGARLISKLTYKTYKDGKPAELLHELASDLIYDLWKDYIKANIIDVAKFRTWNDFVGEDVSNGLPRDGSILWLIHCFNPSKKDALNKYGIALQQFDILRINRNLSLPADGNGNKVINGIELNKYGSRTAIYLDLNNETNAILGAEALLSYKVSFKGNNYLRLPMLDENNYKYEGIYAYYYDCDPSPLPEQVWGRPWASVALPYMHADAKLDYALQVAAIAGASKSVVIRRDAQGNSPEQNILRSSSGGASVQIVPGQVNILDQGQQIDTIDFDLPYDGTLAFSQKILRGVAASLAVPYPELTSDYDRSSYSVETSSEVRNNRLWHQRRNHIISNLLEPFIRFWYRKTVHNDLVYYFDGEQKFLNKPMLYDMANCLTFQFDNIERPLSVDDEKATSIRLANGLTTIQDEIISRGGNPEEVLKKRVNEIAKLNELGIKINGYNFNVEEAGINAEIEKNKLLASQNQNASNQNINRTITNIETDIENTRNIQQTILRTIADLNIDIKDKSNKELLQALVTTLNKPTTVVEDKPIIRRYSVTERDDGTFDLNTLKVIEEKAELDIVRGVEVKTVETVTDNTDKGNNESTEVVVDKEQPLKEIEAEFNTLLNDIKNLS